MGLAAMPGVGASIVTISRQRQRQIDRQLVRGKLRLNELQQRRRILDEQLQVRHKDCQSIESRVSQLHSLAANLTNRINTDRDRHQQLEQQLVSIASYCQEQEILSTKLDRKIQEQQAHLLEIDTNSISLKVESPQVQTAQDRLVEIAALEDIANRSLVDIQTEIEQCSTIKGELDRQIQDLQSQQQLEDTNFRELVERQQLLLHETDSAIKDRQQRQEDLTAEIEKLELVLSEKSPESNIIEKLRLEGEWYYKFIDNPHLTVLQHIEKHGTITETEASSKLGNARSVRQFANKLEEYAQDLPFSIRVESSSKGNRYLKEDRN